VGGDAVRVELPSAGRNTPLVSGRGLAAVLDRPFVAILIFSIAVLKIGSLGLQLSRSFDPLDFGVYYCSGLLFRLGQNPYIADLFPIAKQLGLEKGYIAHANSTPTFVVSFAPDGGRQLSQSAPFY
jgi:hypothetical protein